MGVEFKIERFDTAGMAQVVMEGTMPDLGGYVLLREPRGHLATFGDEVVGKVQLAVDNLRAEEKEWRFGTRLSFSVPWIVGDCVLPKKTRYLITLERRRENPKKWR